MQNSVETRAASSQTGKSSRCSHLRGSTNNVCCVFSLLPLFFYFFLCLSLLSFCIPLALCLFLSRSVCFSFSLSCFLSLYLFFSFSHFVFLSLTLFFFFPFFLVSCPLSIFHCLSSFSPPQINNTDGYMRQCVFFVK